MTRIVSFPWISEDGKLHNYNNTLFLSDKPFNVIEYERDFMDVKIYSAHTENKTVRTLSEYQILAARTMKEQSQRDGLLEAALGLMDEAGEVAGPVKKWAFHGHELDKDQLAEEIGDVCWYLAALATVLDLSLESIATQNIAKLCQRYPEGFSDERSRERES